MHHTNIQKPTTYTAARKHVEEVNLNTLKQRLNRGFKLLVDSEDLRDPVQRELAQARVLQNIAETTAQLEDHEARAKFRIGG